MGCQQPALSQKQNRLISHLFNNIILPHTLSYQSFNTIIILSPSRVRFACMLLRLLPALPADHLARLQAAPPPPLRLASSPPTGSARLTIKVDNHAIKGDHNIRHSDGLPIDPVIRGLILSGVWTQQHPPG